jgi:hypothetical protein
MFATTIATVLSVVSFSATSPIDHLLAAIRYKESKGNNHAIGDSGRAKGPYQIHRNYWKDACEFGRVNWSYDGNVENPEKSKQIVKWYWQKYAPSAYLKCDLRYLARMHNGGTGGNSCYATIKYWKDVKRIMKN